MLPNVSRGHCVPVFRGIPVPELAGQRIASPAIKPMTRNTRKIAMATPLGDGCRACGDTGEAEHAGDNGDDEENKGPLQHGLKPPER